MSAGSAWRGIAIAFLAMGFLSGCGGSDGYDVSGNVTFNGQPVPAGKIYFIPDSSKGNSGASGYANIENGRYDTAAPGGQGTVGGPMLVEIEGYDPSQPAQQAQGDTSGEQTVKTLFPSYQTTVELPKEDTTKDFEVPAAAAYRRDQPERPQIVP